MRSKAMVVMALGLMLAAPRAFAQHSDLLPRQELRHNLRRLQNDLRDSFSSREFAGRIRAEALANARIARERALSSARIQREITRSMARERTRDFARIRAPRFHMPSEPRVHLRFRRRDI